MFRFRYPKSAFRYQPCQKMTPHETVDPELLSDSARHFKQLVPGRVSWSTCCEVSESNWVPVTKTLFKLP